MQVIYEPRGKAREFTELALNLYVGCGHDCRYCWGSLMMHKTRDVFHLNPKPRPDILYHVEENASRLAAQKETRPVLISIATDPYQGIDRDHGLTRLAITILHGHGLNVNILTKGGLCALRDFDLLSPGDIFSVTLTCVLDNESTFWEPLAGLPGDRIGTLEEARRLGLKTWVSLEPILDLDATLELIDMSHEFTDHYKVGKLNYYEKLLDGKVDWRNVAAKVVMKLDKVKANYYLKSDLAKYVGHKNGIWVINRQ